MTQPMMQQFPSYTDEEQKKWIEDVLKKAKREEELSAIGRELNLPVSTSSHAPGAFVLMEDLLKIFSDEQRVKEICSKLKNKAFW